MNNLEFFCRHIQTHSVGTELVPLRADIEERPELLTVASGGGSPIIPYQRGMIREYYVRYIPSRDFPCHQCGRLFYWNQVAWAKDINKESELYMCSSCHWSQIWGIKWQPA